MRKPKKAPSARSILAAQDPLKYKAQAIRVNFMNRAPDCPMPREIEAWLRAQTFICHYSGVQLSHTTFEVDHKDPTSRGGSNTFDNWCICSREMNGAKGTMTEQEFKALLLLVRGWSDGGKKVLARLRANPFSRR